MSNFSIFEFEWSVRRGDFEWVRARSNDPARRQGEAWYLTDRRPQGRPRTDGYKTEPVKAVRYNPLEDHTGLFREFAELDCSRDAIAAFANQYGCLDVKRIYHGDIACDISPVDFHGKEKPIWVGESLGDWVDEIRAMRELVGLWEMLLDEDIDGLSERIRWPKPQAMGHKAIYYEPADKTLKRGVIATGYGVPSEITNFVYGDFLEPARAWIEMSINLRLLDRASPQLVPNGHRERSRFAIVPRALIGALWLQFARAVGGNENIQRCDNCHSWYRVAPNISPGTRLYCSNSCRTMAYRRRKARAVELHAARKPIREIANELGSTIETVKKWVR